MVASTSWMILRSADGIGSSASALPGLDDLGGDIASETLEGGAATLAVPGDVDPQAGLVIAEPALGGDPGEILDRRERAATGADQQTEVVAGDRHLELAVDRGELGRAAEAERIDQALDEGDRRRADGGRIDGRVLGSVRGVGTASAVVASRATRALVGTVAGGPLTGGTVASRFRRPPGRPGLRERGGGPVVVDRCPR